MGRHLAGFSLAEKVQRDSERVKAPPHYLQYPPPQAWKAAPVLSDSLHCPFPTLTPSPPSLLPSSFAKALPAGVSEKSYLRAFKCESIFNPMLKLGGLGLRPGRATGFLSI